MLIHNFTMSGSSWVPAHFWISRRAMFVAAAFAVRTVAGDGVVGVDDGEDAGADADLIGFPRARAPDPAASPGKFDGSGLPARLKGEEICIGARIFAVVDTYDAITSDRPYRKSSSYDHRRRRDPEVRRHPARPRHREIVDEHSTVGVGPDPPRGGDAAGRAGRGGGTLA